MTLSDESRAAFVHGYTRALVSTWSDDGYAARLDDDPARTLREAGVDLPPDATVEVVHVELAPDDPDEGGVAAQVELYEQGLATRRFAFYVPSVPRVATEELTEQELHGVAAGGIWDPYCCSCCPNCCSANG